MSRKPAVNAGTPAVDKRSDEAAEAGPTAVAANEDPFGVHLLGQADPPKADAPDAGAPQPVAAEAAAPGADKGTAPREEANAKKLPPIAKVVKAPPPAAPVKTPPREQASLAAAPPSLDQQASNRMSVSPRARPEVASELIATQGVADEQGAAIHGAAQAQCIHIWGHAAQLKKKFAANLLREKTQIGDRSHRLREELQEVAKQKKTDLAAVKKKHADVIDAAHVAAIATLVAGVGAFAADTPKFGTLQANKLALVETEVDGKINANTAANQAAATAEATAKAEAEIGARMTIMSGPESEVGDKTGAEVSPEDLQKARAAVATVAGQVGTKMAEMGQAGIDTTAKLTSSTQAAVHRVAGQFVTGAYNKQKATQESIDKLRTDAHDGLDGVETATGNEIDEVIQKVADTVGALEREAIAALPSGESIDHAIDDSAKRAIGGITVREKQEQAALAAQVGELHDPKNIDRWNALGETERDAAFDAIRGQLIRSGGRGAASIDGAGTFLGGQLTGEASKGDAALAQAGRDFEAKAKETKDRASADAGERVTKADGTMGESAGKTKGHLSETASRTVQWLQNEIRPGAARMIGEAVAQTSTSLRSQIPEIDKQQKAAKKGLAAAIERQMRTGIGGFFKNLLDSTLGEIAGLFGSIADLFTGIWGLLKTTGERLGQLAFDVVQTFKEVNEKDGLLAAFGAASWKTTTGLVEINLQTSADIVEGVVGMAGDILKQAVGLNEIDPDLTAYERGYKKGHAEGDVAMILLTEGGSSAGEAAAKGAAEGGKLVGRGARAAEEGGSHVRVVEGERAPAPRAEGERPGTRGSGEEGEVKPRDPAKEEPTRDPAKEEPTRDPAKDEPTRDPAKDEPARDPAKEEPARDPAKDEPARDPAKDPVREPAKDPAHDPGPTSGPEPSTAPDPAVEPEPKYDPGPGSDTPPRESAPGDRLGTEPKEGKPATPETIRSGECKMREHPRFAEVKAGLDADGFALVETDHARVRVAEFFDRSGALLRTEKAVHVKPNMRFLDLEHELGHIEQWKRNGRPATERLIDDGVHKPVNAPDKIQNKPGLLFNWQNALWEYENRLQEVIRLADRDAPRSVLEEHQAGVTEYRQKWKSQYRGDISPTRRAYQQEHFPDLPDLERRYQEKLKEKGIQ